jgi:hypothetical protein
MKKLIFLFAFVGIFFIGIHSANAQWEVYVDVNDTECNCGTITGNLYLLQLLI